MIEKLKSIEKKYDEINAMLMSPEVVSDIELYKKLMKEQKTLAPVVEKYHEYAACETAIEDAKEIIASGDSELKELAEAEIEENKNRLPEITDELRVLLLPKDPNDDRNVIIEIRGGAGGEEAALFASVLYRMYTMYAESKGFKSELNYVNETGLGGFKEVSFMVEGYGAYSRFKFESGVHRVQRVPETEASGRIHTSTVTVAVLPEADEVEIEINPDDLEITRHRSSGAGGQHVNKTESAIRIIHKPTGIEVDCQDERSQLKNKDKAMKILRSRVYELERAKADEKLSGERRSQVGTGDRSERIRTYNYPQGRVSDHRIGLTLYSLEYFLNGKLDEMIDALITADRAEQLKVGLDG
ncbi:MAG: peptide chain release factor 1 [Eubacteriales bacterium]|nr:peptide chain release factor 1 [Eubacteriales bacterium]MDD4475392.1 peptide chain release factor 1 [Eubacteriales bacterium]